MENKIKTNKLPKGEPMQNFTNYEVIGNNPYNRYSGFSKEEDEKALRAGITRAEIKASHTNIKGNMLSIRNNGYIGLIFLPVFRTRRGKYILLDGHHLFRAIKEVSAMQGERIPINIMVYKESKNFTLGYASQLMCDMNKNGAKPWNFIDIMRSYATPNAKKFVQLFNKYNGVITSVAVIADATLNDCTTTKRATIEPKWGTMEDTTWGYADEYLNTLAHININRAISQAGADAFRSLFKRADEYGVRDIFINTFTKCNFTITFGKGRPNTEQWRAQFVNALKTNRYEGYNELSQSRKAKYNRFLVDVYNNTDWKGLCKQNEVYKGVA